MKISIYKFKDQLYVSLSGRIVLEECDKFKTSILAHIDKSLNQIYIDLENVDFIDSAGLGVLVGLKMTSNKNKSRLILSNPSRGVYDILYVSKLDNIFDIITGKEAESSKKTLTMSENLIKEYDEKGGVKEFDALAPKLSKQPVIQQPRESESIPAYNPAVQIEPPPQMQEPQKANTIKDAEVGKDPQEAMDDYCKNAVEFMRQGYYEKAVEEYKKALQINNEYLPALNNLAIVYEKKPSWASKAIEQWEKVLEISKRENDPKHIDRANKHLENLRKMV